jgi:hypothetical protein
MMSRVRNTPRWALVKIKENGLYESDRHIHYVSSFANVHQFLTRWAFDLPD